VYILPTPGRPSGCQESSKNDDMDSNVNQPLRDTQLLIIGTQGIGGIGQYIREQHRHLADELQIATHDIGSISTDKIVSFIESILVIFWNAIRFIMRSPPDIVHVHTSHRFSFYRAGFYALFAAHIWNRPVVLHIHGSSFDAFVSTESTLVQSYQSAIFDAADEIIVLSEYWRETLSPHTDEEKLTVIPNAVDVDDYTPLFDGDVPHIVFISNITENKGITELVTAVNNLARSDHEFRISVAGKGPLSNRAETLATDYDNVRYLGYISEAKKQELLSKTSIFVLPSYAEGLPIAMLEAMAGGNAIVSTTVGSIPEVIDEENGVLVEPGNADQLADTLAELIANTERTSMMGQANREAVEQEYAWSSVAERLLRTYNRHLS
jgi:glycosyltransferase involved in cell wall biosynthesis